MSVYATYTYILINDGAAYEVVCSNISEATIAEIPSEYNGRPVTSIGERAFYYCLSLTSVVIPDSVTSIGYEAFRGCKSLTEIVIPDSVTSIGEGAFYDCSSLTSITIPDSITSIGDFAFSRCDSLISITFKNSVPITYDSDWFIGTPISAIYVPYDSVEVYKSAWAEVADKIYSDPDDNIIITLGNLKLYNEQVEKRYVKNTDYATAETAGVVKINNANGIRMTNNNEIYIDSSNDNEIINQTAVNSPIKPNQLPLAVKSGLIKHDNIEWTDADKTKACETIGALKTITNTYGENVFRVYSIDNQGNQQIVRTTDNTNVLSSKTYVDGLIAELQAQITALTNGLTPAQITALNEFAKSLTIETTTTTEEA